MVQTLAPGFNYHRIVRLPLSQALPSREALAPSTAGGARAGEHAARPPARFSSLRGQKTVNQKQEPWG